MAGVARLNSGARSRLAASKSRFRASVVRTGGGKNTDSDVRFDHAPIFNFNDDQVKFDTNSQSNANENYGSASGFVPKSLPHHIKGIQFRMPFILKGLCVRSNPSAEHSAYFIYFFLKRNVLFKIDCFRFLHKSNEKTQRIQLNARFFK
mgnify:CR=1 FL=1